MKPEVRAALEKSIEKWKENAKVERIGDARIFVSSCPLCRMFYIPNRRCDGCPVNSATGLSDCSGSPWEAARAMLYSGDLGAFREAALQEVEFLKSLLPKKGWQRMLSAPRDGTKIQVYGYFAGEINGISNEPEIGVAKWTGRRTDYSGFEWDGVHSDGYATWWKPLRWRELPKAPRIKS